MYFEIRWTTAPGQSHAPSRQQDVIALDRFIFGVRLRLISLIHSLRPGTRIVFQTSLRALDLMSVEMVTDRRHVSLVLTSSGAWDMASADYAEYMTLVIGALECECQVLEIVVSDAVVAEALRIGCTNRANNYGLIAVTFGRARCAGSSSLRW